jgi:hypothetical protein
MIEHSAVTATRQRIPHVLAVMDRFGLSLPDDSAGEGLSEWMTLALPHVEVVLRQLCTETNLKYIAAACLRFHPSDSLAVAVAAARGYPDFLLNFVPQLELKEVEPDLWRSWSRCVARAMAYRNLSVDVVNILELMSRSGKMKLIASEDYSMFKDVATEHSRNTTLQFIADALGVEATPSSAPDAEPQLCTKCKGFSTRAPEGTPRAQDEGLWQAVKVEGHLDCVLARLQRNADPCSRHDGGASPLHWAAKHGFTDYLRVMVGEASRVDVRDDRDSTPLHEAAREGHVLCVRHLLKMVGAGAPMLRDADDKTALQLARAGKKLNKEGRAGDFFVCAHLIDEHYNPSCCVIV